ncbi:hypothetical protein SAMN05216324_103110 [Chryseobacterium limigenitum]|uniref:Uncharacterized protein n=1 Tax=Chryseobacterium limigenitum TaxID=1612149 RepID=A0A1K2II39_9FLAO|nr:hypothetical protein SAMN05216324_103110 [Chryseobacterium limigenitum]
MIINNLKCVFHDKDKMSPGSVFYSVLKGFVMVEFVVLFLVIF